MLVVPRDADATMVDPPARGATGGRAARRVRSAAVGGDRGPDGHRRRARRRTRRPLAIGDQTWARFVVELLPRLPGGHVPPRRRRRRAAADGQGRRRDRRVAGRRCRRRPGRPATAGRRDRRSSGAPRREVSADLSARLLAEGHDKVNFAIVAAGANAASPHHDAGDRVIADGRDRAVRLRRHDGRLLQRHDTLRVHGDAAGRGGGGVRGAAPRPAGGGGRGDDRDAVRGRRPHGPADHRRRRVRRPLHPPHRARHRPRGARGSLHRRGQRARRCRRGTPSPSSPASTWPGGGGCGWRTSSSPRPTVPSR